MPDAVIAALAGVVVGALLNFVLTHQVERRREFQIARGIARLVRRHLLVALLLIDDGQRGKKWPPEQGFQFETGDWPQCRMELARVLDDDVFFDAVNEAFRMLDVENLRIREGKGCDAEQLALLKKRAQGGVLATDWLMKPRWQRLRDEVVGRVPKVGRLVSRGTPSA